MSAYRELWAHRDLLILLVGRNLKLRYKQTSLGFFWSLLGPLFQIVIYKIFLGILKVEVTIESLVTGIFMWQFLATTVGDSLTVIVGHATLIKKTPFPRIVLPLSTALANFVNFALSVVVPSGKSSWGGETNPSCRGAICRRTKPPPTTRRLSSECTAGRA